MGFFRSLLAHILFTLLFSKMGGFIAFSVLGEKYRDLGLGVAAYPCLFFLVSKGILFFF